MVELGGDYAKWNKAVRDKQTLNITYMCNLRKTQQTSEYNKTETDIENKLGVTGARGKEGGGR